MDEYRIRVRFFSFIILAVLGLLTLRVAQMQILDSQEYTGESRSNSIREIRVLPARGAFYDRNGILMVANEQTFAISVIPRYFDPSRIELLAELLEVPDTTVVRKLKEARAWSAFRPTRAFREVRKDVLARVLENLYRLPGVSYEVEQKRMYLTPANAAHAMGYIREITGGELGNRRDEGYRQGDMIGKAGVEKNYEGYLRGHMGSEFKLVNIRGLEVQPYREGSDDKPPLSGYDLHLTLDSQVQALAESLFVGKRGAAVAIDPTSGEIIALLSKPDFDPEIFSQSVDPETWKWLTTSKEKPMYNRATMNLMPPGSTWKPFMALMALQEGAITPTSRVNCPGYHPLGGGRMFRCMHVHGSLEVLTAITKSCNTFFFEMMMRTDVNTFSKYAHMFGFGENAPTDIAEQTPGLIPDSTYFNRSFPAGWTVGYSINLGIGQGNMGVTPLQMANYMAAIANEGTLYAPHLVRELVQPETGERVKPNLPAPRPIPIKKEYFDIVRLGMRQVMEQGTGRGVQLPGIPSGGKTGTAQSPNKGKDDSVFIMFAPYDNPRIAIAVQVENAGFGAVAAGPIASLMAEQYLTGKISPERKALAQRVAAVRSQAL